MLPPAMDETFDDIERDWNQKDRNQACGQHPAEDGESQQHSPMRPGAGRHDQWKHAEDECERRHQDGTESQSCSGQRGIGDRLAIFIFDFRKLHDEDRILGRQADQHHQSDLGKDVVLTCLRSHQLQQPSGAEGTEDGDRRSEQHAEW